MNLNDSRNYHEMGRKQGLPQIKIIMLNKLKTMILGLKELIVWEKDCSGLIVDSVDSLCLKYKMTDSN